MIRGFVGSGCIQWSPSREGVGLGKFMRDDEVLLMMDLSFILS